MTYDIFVIYFLFAPTLALTIGILVSYPKKVVKYFLLISFTSSLVLSLYFSLFNYLLVNLNIKKINFYFLGPGESPNFISFLNFCSYFIIPWFINSLGLLIDRFYPEKADLILNRKGKLKKINFKLIIYFLLFSFLLSILLLTISLLENKWAFFKVLSLNIISLSPLFLLTFYIRKKRKFLFLTEFNISSIVLSLYVVISSLFISEFMYSSKAYPMEDIIYSIFIYILSGEVTVSIIALFYDEILNEKKQDTFLVKKGYPAFKKALYNEKESKDTNFPNFEDNE